jgi:predicted molibdopterin-dependent oxidoreductase YjgC
MPTTPDKPLFRLLPDTAGAAPATLTIHFNGMPLQVSAGRSVAAALLAAGVRRFRATPVHAAPRAPYCMMGVCFECLVEIDGVPSRQSCLVEVRDGMQIHSQEGARDLPPQPQDAREKHHGA